MTIAKMTIDGILCELEPTDDDGRIDCFLTKGRFSASLAGADGEGVLWANDFEESLPVSSETLGRITAWALRHGY